MSESRDDRLIHDYHEMMKIQNRPYLSWIVTKGEPPCAREYLLTVRLRTYALTVRSGRYTVGVIRRCTIRVTLWDSYPKAAPHITMLNIPPVFAPDWYSKGTYSPSQPWREDTSLKDYILQMLKTLQYDLPDTPNTAPANYKAQDWYQKCRHDRSLFPCDATKLTENDPLQTSAAAEAADLDEIIDSWGIR